MTISLSPEHEKLLQEKVRNGEFPSVEALVEFALDQLLVGAGRRAPVLTPDERLRVLDEFFAEVDRDPSPGVDALPEEALSRRNLYNDHRNQL